MPLADFRFRFAKRVRYGEIDAQGVVYFARYLDYADIGVVEYWRAAGIFAHTGILGGEAEFHVVRAEVDYRAPMLLDEEILIAAACTHIGRSSARFSCELHGLANGQGQDDLRARIEQVQVHVAEARGAPAPVPDWIVTCFEAFEGRKLRTAA
ncbi:MAG: thioesterase family protein [Sphingomonadaceae bacterium]